MIKDQYATQKEAAGILGVSAQTVWLWTSGGKLRSEKVGREVLIRRRDLKKVRKVGHGGRPKTKG